MQTWLAARASAFAALCAFGMQPVVAQAQATLPMTPDRSGSNHPVVGVSASGVPLVNIVAPNQAGVSLNNFTNYNVGTQGAVIVNTPRSAQTQIAGWVQGNPLMGNAPARLIINQVTSGNPTRLLGMTEIAGNRANLVIANPAGITCAGCGFINAPRVSLATALPTFNVDGSLAGFDVSRGRLGVTGGGLDARGSAIDLIARAMQINGKVWAESIAATAGANEVNYADGAALSKAGDGEKPVVAIDVQALGGMYANSVRLIGTEAGVGVRHSGDISTLTGAIELSANGDITIEPTGRIQAAGQIQIDAPNLANAGTIASRQAVRIRAEDSLRNDGLVAARFNVGLAARDIANGGALIAGVNTPDAPSGPGSVTLTGINLSSSGTLAAGDNVNVTGTTVSLDGGDVFAASALNVTGDQSISTNAATMAATNATLKTNGTLINEGGSAHVVKNMKIDAHSVSNRLDGTVVAQTLVVDAAHVDNVGGYLLSRENTQIRAADLANDSGHIGSLDGAVHVAVNGGLSNAGGEIAGGSELSLDAQHLISNRGGRIGTVSGDTSIRIDGRANNEQGLIASAGQLNIDSTALNNTQGHIDSARALTVTVEDELTNDRGLIVANDGLTLRAHAIDSNAEGRIVTTAGETRVIVRDEINNANGVLVSAGALDLKAQALDNTNGSIWANGSMVDTTSTTNEGGAIVALTHLKIHSSGDLSNRQGLIVAHDALDVSAQTLTSNTSGTIVSTAGAAALNFQGDASTAGGLVASADHLDLNARRLDNTGGTIRAASAQIDASVLDNTSGVLETSVGKLVVQNEGDLVNNQGNIVGARDLDIRTDRITGNAGGAIGTLTGDASLTAGGAVTNAGGMIASAGQLSVDTAALDNQGGAMQGHQATLTVASLNNNDGRVLSETDMRLHSAGDLANSGGTIVAGDALTARGASLTENRGGQIGTTTGDADIAFQSNARNDGGVIASAGDLKFEARSVSNREGGGIYGKTATVSAAEFQNDGGKIKSRDGAVNLSVTGALSSESGRIVGANGLTVSAGALTNHRDGQIGTVAGDTTLTFAGDADNAHGMIASAGRLEVTSQALDNTSGRVYADTAQISTTDLTNTHGEIESRHGRLDMTNAGALSNDDGHIAGASGLALTADALTTNRNGQIGTRAGDTTLTFEGNADNSQGLIASAGHLTMKGQALDNASGHISANTAQISTTDLANTDGVIQSRLGSMDLKASGSIDNERGSVVGAKGLNFDAASITSNDSGQIGSLTGKAQLNVESEFNNAGGTLGAGDKLTIRADNFDNASGLALGDAIHITVNRDIRNSNGRIVSTHETNIKSETLSSNNDGVIGSLQGPLNVATTGVTDNEGGKLLAAGDVTLANAGFINTKGTVAGADIDLKSGDGQIVNTHGLIEARGRVLSESGTLDNRYGQIRSAAAESPMPHQAEALGATLGGAPIGDRSRDIRLTVGGDTDNTHGTIASAGTLALKSEAFDNTSGYVQADSARMSTAQLTNHDDGMISTRTGRLEVESSGALSNAGGKLIGANGLSVDAASIVSNEGGQIGTRAGAAQVTARAGLSNAQGMISAAEALTVRAADFDNTSGTALGEAVNVEIGHRLTNIDGRIVATRTTHVQAETLDNQRGVIGAVNDALTVDTPEAINNAAGKLLAGGAFTSTSAGLINTDGVVSGAHLTLSNGTGHIDNTRGVIDAATRLDTGSGSLDNRSGLIQSGGVAELDTQGGLFDNRAAEGTQTGGRVIGRGVKLTTGVLENTTGLISSADTTRVLAQSVANDHGAILSHQALTLESVGTLSNVSGQIGGDADVTLKGTTVDNTRGAVHAGQALVVTGDEIINAQTKEVALVSVAETPPLQAGMEGANVSLTATTQIDNKGGAIRSDREAILATPIADNTDGAITSAQRVSIHADATVKNTRGEINGGQRVELSTAVLNNDGRIESRGDVWANVRGDLKNVGTIIAGHNLDVQAQGNLHNSGTMNAQNVATVSGQRVDNVSGGEIKGDRGTHIHAGQAVTNEGLIDGGATRVEAADTVTNEGRIYGDSVSLGGQIVRNEANAQGVGAAIASRGDINIGARVIENQGKSLIYAPNDVRTGLSLDANGRASDVSSDRFTNNGSVVDAGGDLKIAAKRFENLNSNFQTQKVTTDSGRQVWYTTPGSTERFDASSVYLYHRGSNEAVPGTNYDWALDDDQKFLLLPSKQYPFAEYAKYAMNGIAGKVGHVRYGPPPRTNIDEDLTMRREADLVGVFREMPDEMWNKFGVAPPPPPPDPRYIKAGNYKVHTLFERRDLGPDWYSLNVPTAIVPNLNGSGTKAESCITAAADHCKPFKAWYDQLSQAYTALGGALQAYDNDVASRTIQSWTIYDVNVQSTKDVVTATQPGMITAGGKVTIDAQTGINDKSQILAGGHAYLNDAIQDNSQPKGVETFTASGEAINTWVSGRRFRGDERKWGRVPYVAPIPSREIDLPIALVAPTNQEPVKRVAADASAARGVSGAHVTGAQVQAIGGLTEAAPGIAEGQDRSVTANAGAAGLDVHDGQLQARANAALTAGSTDRVEAGAGDVIAATAATANSALIGERPASEKPLDVRAPTNAVARAKLGPIEIRTVEPNLTLPGNALYQVVPDPGSRYLVETDPRFTNQRNWLSSETMIAALATNPGSVQKRLGDGFYEQQLIQQQIMQATGQRFIGDYTDNQMQYQALMGNGVRAAERFEMNVGTALTDAQMAALTDDIVWLVNREVTLADGTQQSVLVPQVYLRANAADVTGTGSIISADSVVLNNKEALTNSGTIASRRATIITADSITNVGAISGQTVRAEAKEDLKNLGGLIQGNTVQLTAGRDVSLTGTTNSVTTQNGSATAIDRVASINAGKLAVQAGRDLNLGAAQIAASGDALLLAERDVNLAAIRERSDDHVRWDEKNRAEHSASIDTGTSVVSEGKIAIAAGRDLNATAASVSAKGSLTALAGRDVNLHAGEHSASAYDEHHFKERGALSSKSTHTIDASSFTDAIGTTLSGDTVNVSAGNNLTAKAATIAGTGDVTLEAGHDLRITTADTASHEYHFKDVKKSGLGSAGAGISYGKTQTTDTSVDQANGSRGSLIGSIDGNVSLRAGNKLHVTGSDFIAAQDVTGVAREVKVDASQTNRHYEETHETKSSGISLSVKSPGIDAIQNVNRQAQAAGKSQDGRAAALHGIAAAGGVADLADAAKGMTRALSEGKMPEGKIELSVGSSHSKSTFVLDSMQHNGSTVKAGGTVRLVATGDKSAGQGNVTIEGSDVMAKDVRLMAADKVNLLNSADTERTRSTNESDSASVGVSVGTGGVGASAAISLAHGDGNSDSQTRNNAHVVASNTATIVSGGDTNIVGATILARKVDGDIGGNLNIESVQDTMQSAAHQSSVGAGLNVSAGGGSASLSMQYGRASGEFAGVIEQSGIQAGDGGFDITVKGNTDLKGAYIASTAEPGKNHLTTGTLSYSDIENHSSYRASSVGVSAGGGVGNGGDNYATHGPTTGKNKNPGGALPMAVSESGNSKALTKSAVSAGSLTVLDEANQKQDVTLLNRDATNLNGTVEALPDLQNTLASQADLIDAAQAAAETAAKQVGKYAERKQRQALEAAENETDPQVKAQYEQEAKDWAEGGKYRVGMHIAGGALTGGLTGGGVGAVGGATGAGLSAALAPKFDQLARSIKEAQPTGNGDVDALVGNVTANLLAGGVGALVGGPTGGLASAAVDRFNRQLSPDERRWASDNVEQFAKRYEETAGKSLTVEQARDMLLGTGYRMVDEMASKGPGGDPIATAYISENSGDMFRATPAQYKDPFLFGNVDGSLTPEQSALPGAVANPKAGLAIAAGLATAGVAPTIVRGLTSIPGAPILSTTGVLGLTTWASPVGTGTISATISAGAQYLQNGTINPVDVGGAFVTGALGSKGGLLRNIWVNGLGGAAGTAINNAIYGKSDSIMGAGIGSSLFGAAGYGIGKAGESWVIDTLKPGINGQNWAASGMWSGSGWNLFRPNTSAVVVGTTAGGIGQEITGSASQNLPGFRDQKK